MTAAPSALEKDIYPVDWGAPEEQDEEFGEPLLREWRLIGPQSFRREEFLNRLPDHLKKSQADRWRDGIECFRYFVNMSIDEVETIRSSKDLTKLFKQHLKLKSEGIQFESAVKADKVGLFTAPHSLINQASLHSFHPSFSDFDMPDSVIQTESETPECLLPGDLAIIRTYRYDVELIPPASHMPKTICKTIVKRGIPTVSLSKAPDYTTS